MRLSMGIYYDMAVVVGDLWCGLWFMYSETVKKIMHRPLNHGCTRWNYSPHGLKRRLELQSVGTTVRIPYQPSRNSIREYDEEEY
jgi:hypothetical protein